MGLTRAALGKAENRARVGAVRGLVSRASRGSNRRPRPRLRGDEGVTMTPLVGVTYSLIGP